MSPEGSGGLSSVVDRLGADLGAAFEHVGFLASVVDADGVIRWLNETGRALLGDAVGARYADVLAADTVPKVRQEFTAKLLGTRSRADYEAVAIDREGRRVRLDLSTVPLEDGDGVVGVLVVGRTLHVERAQAERVLQQLTPRQREVLALLEEGRSTTEIATELALSPETVRNHVRHVLRRLGARSRLEAVLEARRLQAIDD